MIKTKYNGGWQGREENGELLFNRHWGSVTKWQELMGMDGGDGCTTMRMYLIPINCMHSWTIHLKMVKRVNFVLRVYYNKKIVISNHWKKVQLTVLGTTGWPYGEKIPILYCTQL